MRSRKTIFGIIGVLVLVLIAGLGFAALSVRAALAQTPTPQSPGGSTTTTTGMSQYGEFFLNKLAGLLGVDETTLKNDIITAFGDTLSQAVKDGNITQSQADQLKNRASQGINSGNFPFLGFGKGRGFFGFGEKMGISSLGPAEFAKALGMNEQDLMTELQAGKSIAQIAQEHNVDLNKVKQTVLADLKTQLDTAVKNGNLTQTQADNIYQNVNNNIDNILNSTGRWGGHWGPMFKHMNPLTPPTTTPAPSSGTSG